MATVKKTAKAATNGLTAYCMKTKEKNVPMLDPVIDISNGKYIAKGHDADGNKLTSILSQSKAEAAVEEGIAEKGQGWTKVATKKK